MLRLLPGLKRKRLLLFLIVAAVIALLFWTGSRPAADPADPVDPEELTAPPVQGLAAPANDAAIYRTLEDYLAALIADDQPAVLALLTAAHRETFGEASFLLQPGARQNFSEITLAGLDHSFPTYTAQFPGLEGQNVAIIAAEYTVNFYQNGQLAEAPRFREELMLRQEEGRWLIVASQRDFLRLAE